MNDRGRGRWDLSDALRALADEESGQGASSAVEARLLTEVRSLERARRRTFYLAGGIAAALIVATSIATWHVSSLRTGSRAVGGTGAAANVVSEQTTEFFPLPYSGVPTSDALIVRMEFPRSALISFGLDFVDGNSGPANVLADVVVGEDGLARAIRFVAPVAAVRRQEQKQ